MISKYLNVGYVSTSSAEMHYGYDEQVRFQSWPIMPVGVLGRAVGSFNGTYPVVYLQTI